MKLLSFLDGCEAVEDEPCSGRPSTQNDKNMLQVTDIIKSDRRLLVRVIGCELNLKC